MEGPAQEDQGGFCFEDNVEGEDIDEEECAIGDELEDVFADH